MFIIFKIIFIDLGPSKGDCDLLNNTRNYFNINRELKTALGEIEARPDAYRSSSIATILVTLVPYFNSGLCDTRGLRTNK